MKLIIESSRVPIYDRIARAFASALMERGYKVYFIDTTGFNDEDFIQTINNIDIDYYLSTNELNKVQSKSEDGSYFLFERVNKKLKFVHHDNLFSCYNEIKTISSKLNAFKAASNRSEHYLLEESNIQLLKAFGINNAMKIHHASEFTPDTPQISHPYGVTFIGHLMSSLKLYPENQVQAGIHLLAQAWQRLHDSSYPIQPAINKIASDKFICSQFTEDINATQSAIHQYLIAGLNKFSSAYRGELISKVKKQRIDIFGGDLSYGKISDPLLVINQPNIYYQPATADYMQARLIYRNSRINMNISSLQFDSAINNRVIDAVMSGGFVLTDDRMDLNFLGDLRDHITYRSPEELEYKISFWMADTNTPKYLEIKKELYDRISETHSYQAILDIIFHN